MRQHPGWSSPGPATAPARRLRGPVRTRDTLVPRCLLPLAEVLLPFAATASGLTNLVLDTWRTRADLRTDDEGVCRARAFFGTHTIRAESDGGKGSTEHELLPEGDGEVTLVVE